jgi:hypothetical protein
VAAVPVIRSGALTLLVIVLIAGHGLTSPAGLTVLSASVLAGLLTGLVVVIAASARITRAVTVAPLVRRVAGLREKSWCAAFLRQRDPGAAGRPRPRAPSAAQAAA